MTEILKVVKDVKNPLFKRKEVELEVGSEIVPSISASEELLSQKFSANKEGIKIKKIKGKFGTKVFSIHANIYSSKDEMESVEGKPKEKKK
jgi:ribosomal protein S24E